MSCGEAIPSLSETKGGNASSKEMKPLGGEVSTRGMDGGDSDDSFPQLDLVLVRGTSGYKGAFPLVRVRRAIRGSGLTSSLKEDKRSLGIGYSLSSGAFSSGRKNHNGFCHPRGC